MKILEKIFCKQKIILTNLVGYPNVGKSAKYFGRHVDWLKTHYSMKFLIPNTVRLHLPYPNTGWSLSRCSLNVNSVQAFLWHFKHIRTLPQLAIHTSYTYVSEVCISVISEASPYSISCYILQRSCTFVKRSFEDRLRWKEDHVIPIDVYASKLRSRFQP